MCEENQLRSGVKESFWESIGLARETLERQREWTVPEGLDATWSAFRPLEKDRETAMPMLRLYRGSVSVSQRKVMDRRQDLISSHAHNTGNVSKATRMFQCANVMSPSFLKQGIFSSGGFVPDNLWWTNTKLLLFKVKFTLLARSWSYRERFLQWCSVVVVSTTLGFLFIYLFIHAYFFTMFAF